MNHLRGGEQRSYFVRGLKTSAHGGNVHECCGCGELTPNECGGVWGRRKGGAMGEERVGEWVMTEKRTWGQLTMRSQP